MVRSAPHPTTNRAAIMVPIEIARRADRERDAERQGRKAVDILQHKGRGRNPGEQPRHAAGGDAEVDDEDCAPPRNRRYERRIDAIDTVSGARRRSVSGNSNHTMTAATAPTANSTTKFDRQPNAVCSTPPISGATSGASAMIAAMRESSRPMRDAVVHVAHHGARQHDGARSRRPPGRSAQRSASRWSSARAQASVATR